MAMLKRGTSGEPVRLLQAKLNVPVDGDFGPGTDKALRDYQQKNGLTVDGIAGPDTFFQMGLYELVLLKVGTHGETVKKLQTALGIPADGNFGPGTEKAVRDYQQKNGLDADGMAGPVTLAKMKLFAEMTPAVVAKSVMTEAAAVTAGASAVVGAAATKLRSIWDTVKGWVS